MDTEAKAKVVASVSSCFTSVLKPQFHEKSMAFYPMSYFSKAKQGSAN